MDERGRVVVGIDGSPGSRAALVYALRDAARRGVAVEAVAAFTPPDYPGYETWAPLYGPVPVPVDQMRDEVRHAAERTVEEVTGELAAEAAAPPVSVRVVVGRAADALPNAAEGAGLLVVGSRGRGGFRSMLLGSVSLACALHSPCPVTVVRPSRHATADEPVVAQAAGSGS